MSINYDHICHPQIQPGSPAEGHLRPGDRIIGIGNAPTHNLTHMQANHLIKSAGNAVQFTIIRWG